MHIPIHTYLYICVYTCMHIYIYTYIHMAHVEELGVRQHERRYDLEGGTDEGGHQAGPTP